MYSSEPEVTATVKHTGILQKCFWLQLTNDIGELTTSFICQQILRQVHFFPEASNVGLMVQVGEREESIWSFHFKLLFTVIVRLSCLLQNKCNVGYAFINMTEPSQIIPFYKVCLNQLKMQLNAAFKDYSLTIRPQI